MASVYAQMMGTQAASQPRGGGPYTPQVRTAWETGLEPDVVAKARELQALAAREGIEVGIVSGHRTREDQEKLYAQGRTAPGAIVTHATPGTSRHESGRAVDVVPLKDGKPDWKSPYWGRLGELGKGLGFEWGGEWKRFKDRPHFQLTAAAATAPGGGGGIPGSERLSPAFRAKVDQVARRLKMDPAHLLTVMSFETAGTFDPAMRNEAGSGATGLIQFMPKTARGLGTTTDELARMTPEQQLGYVERYLKPYAGRMTTQQDAYLAVLNPSAMGKPASHVLFTQGTPQYALNKALDKEGKGRVTVGDTVASVGRFLTGLLTPASAEAAPMSPARPEPGGRVGSVYDQMMGQSAPRATTAPPPAAVAPPPAASPTATPGVGSVYGQMAPPPPPPPQSLLGQAWQWGKEHLLQPAYEYGMESLTGPIPAEYYAPKAAPPLLQQAGQMAIPTITTAIGAGLAGVPGAMAGSYAGRRANVALGLEQPGMVGDIASVALPAAPSAVRGATRATRAAVRHLPGASTAMHEEVFERLGTQGHGLRPERPVADYFADAAQHNPQIPATGLHATSNAILRAEMRLQPAARNADVVRLAEDLRDLVQQGPVPLRDLDAHRRRIGEMVRQSRHRGDTGSRQIQRLYGAFHDDMERAAQRGVPGAEELRTAIAASRRDHAAEEFLEFFQPGKNGITQDPQGRISINGGRMASNWRARLRRDDVFRESLRPEEMAEVEEIITLAQRLERLRPPRGAQYGSGRGLGRAVVGSLAAGPVGTAIAVAGPDAIGWAMQTARGRAAVRWALQEGGGRINPEQMAVIAALARPAAQEAVAPPASETGGGPASP